MNESIPQQVIGEAVNYIAHYGQHIAYLGQCQGQDYYRFLFPKDSLTGFPVVFVFDHQTNEVMTISDRNALDIINSF